MSNKVKDALEKRKKKLSGSASDESENTSYSSAENKVSYALEARKNRISNDANYIVNNLYARYKLATDKYNSDISENLPTWGADADKVYKGQSDNRLSISNIKKDVEAYRRYLGDKTADEMLKSLETMSKGYDNIYSNAQVYSQYETEDAYNEAVKLNELYGMSTEAIQPYIDKDPNGIAYTTSSGQNITWKSLYDNKKEEEDFNNLYTELSSKDDWNEQSQYITTNKKGKNRSNSFFDFSTDWEYEDVNQFVPTGSASGVGRDRGYALQTTDEEKAIFNYIYHTQGRDAAFDWHKSREGIYKDRLEEQGIENARMLADKHPVLATAISPVSNAMSAVEYIGDTINYATTGELDDNQYAKVTSTMRGTITDKVDMEIGNWDAFDFVYNTGMSMTDSLVNQALFGKAGGVVLGLSAAAQGTNDALERGMSNGQAFMNGFTSGVFEGLFETVSLGQFSALKETASVGFKGFAKNLAKSMLVNASEETATELANIAYDTVFNGDFSQYETAIRQYMEDGMSEADAKRKVALELGAQVAEAAASGALMGIGMGGIAQGSNVYNSAQEAGKYKKTGQVDAVTDFAKSLGDGTLSNDLAQNINQDSSKYQIGKLLRALEVDVNNLNHADVVKSLERKGISTKEASKVASYLVDSLKGENFNYFQRRAVTNNENIGQTHKDLIFNENSTVNQRLDGYYELRELANEQAGVETQTEEQVKAEAKTPSKSAPFAMLSQKEVARRMSEDPAFATEYMAWASEKAAPKDENVSPKLKVLEEAKTKASDDGATRVASTGQEVTIKGIKSIDKAKQKDGTIKKVAQFKVTDSEGNESVVPSSDIAYGSESDAILYEAFVDMGISTAYLDSYLSNFNAKNFDSSKGNPAIQYALGFEEAFGYGYGDISTEFKGVRNDVLAQNLDSATRNHIYNLGSNARKYADKTVQDTIDAVVNSRKESGQGKVRTKGTLYFDDEDIKKRTKMQNAGIAIAKRLTELGMDVHIYKSHLNEKGIRVDDRGKIAPNGFYRGKDGSIHIDLYAGAAGQSTMVYTMAHELVHFMRAYNPREFKVFADLLIKWYGEKGKSVSDLIKQRMQDEKLSWDKAYEEVIADSCEAFLLDGNIMERVAELKNKDKKTFEIIWDKIKELLNWVRSLYSEYEPDSAEGQFLHEMKDTCEELYDAFARTLYGASENFQWAGTIGEAKTNAETLRTAGITLDTETGSAVMESVRYAPKTEAEVNKVAKALSESMGVGIEQAKAWVRSETSLSSIILDPSNAMFLDYEADDRYEAVKKNADYPQGTVDFSNLCKKRREFTALYDKLQKEYPNRVFTAEDLEKIRQVLIDEKVEVACGLCYVEERRQLLGEIAQGFIDGYQNGILKDKVAKVLDAKDKYVPTIYDLITYDGYRALATEHPSIAEAFRIYNNARGMQAGRLIEGLAEYKREILGWSQKKVDFVNSVGGLRVFSFSDFEATHLIDLVQVIQDCATKGIMIQAYTKVPAFANAVKDTNVKVNRSLIANGTGIKIENGKQVLDFDPVEGIDINDKDFFDSADSESVGNVLVGMADDQIRLAMKNSFVDYIIPFHTGLKNDILHAKKIDHWQNYKNFQTDKEFRPEKVTYKKDGSIKSDGWVVADKQINVYVDVFQAAEAEGKPITNKVEFVNKFLAVAKERGMKPRFWNFLDVDTNGEYVYTEGYHKFLVDFKLFDKDGKILPQKPVVPVFNDALNARILNEYVAGKKAPVSRDKVYNRLVKEIILTDDDIKMSVRKDIVDVNGKEYDSVVELEYDVFNKVKRRGKLYIDYIRDNLIKETITVYDENGESERIEFAGEKERVKKDGSKNFKRVLGELEQARNSLKKLVILNSVETAEVSYLANHNDENSHQWLDENGWDERTSYVMADDGMIYPVTLYIAKTKDGRNILYDVNVKIKEGIAIDRNATSLRAKKLAEQAVKVAMPSDEGTISQDEEKVKRSTRKQYAPTFYSKMEQTINDIKINKMGAGGVVPYLTGKGVKKEEIKWSGIETFLQGKKSVTKEELQEFVAGNQLQIDEQMSGYNKEAYEELDALWKKHAGVSLAETFSDDFDLPLTPDNMADIFDDMEREGYDLPFIEDQLAMIELAKKVGNEGRWAKYKLGGGKNYREIVFTMPNSTYSNNAMQTHWGSDAEGVLAHARIQDFDVDGKKMLFIEEIQSDWHNEGHKKGYDDNELYEKQKALKKKAHEVFLMLEDYSVAATGFAGEWETIKKTPRGAKLLREYREVEAELKKVEDAYIRAIPDAPFHNTYHEYVLKRLIRMAAEEDYDSIGWTPADIQSERWSDEFAEGYHIEYDQDIPKFLKKYGKQWGATVGSTTLNGDTEVWSMNITDSMKDSALYEGQVKFQNRKTDSTSTRSLLANALESVTQNDIEKNKLQQYHEKIDLINAEEKKLHELKAQIKDLSFSKGPKDTATIRKLQDEATRTASRINTYDRQLLNLEATTPLKNVLEREKQLAKKREKQKAKEALDAYREKRTAVERKLIERYQEARKRGIEGRNKTEMRHKIQKVVKDLNDYLLNGTKDKHVPLKLQKAVAEALDAINMDTVGADERVAKYNALIAKATDPDVISSLTETRDRIQAQGDKMGERISHLKSAYKDICDSQDPDMVNAYDETIVNFIDRVEQTVGDTPLRNMTLRQLEDVYDMYRAVLTTVQKANSLFKFERSESISTIANRVLEELDEVGKKKDYVLGGKLGAAVDTAKKFDWNNLKPVYAFERIGSKTLSQAYENVRKGEDTWATDITEAKEFKEEMADKYHYKKWDFDKVYTFETSTGHEFKLTLEQMMSLYAYSKREQADEHLSIGGFVFNDDIEIRKETVTEKGKKKKSILKYKVNTSKAHKVDKVIVAEIISKLSEDQKGFVDEMQSYLSTVMGAKGNEVSMALYDIKLYKEQNYFPLKSAQQYMFEQNQVAGETRIKNSGFSKGTVVHAKNPIILDNFLDVWANHVNDMSMYHAFVLPLEDFNRVFNYKTPASESMDVESVKGFIQDAYGRKADEYISQLLKDLNGGARIDPRESTSKAMIGAFKKASVIASLSVVVQQPSAVARALAHINIKYFDIDPKLFFSFKEMKFKKIHKELWAELKKYAPVAIIKEMGRFDTDMGKSTVDYIKAENTFMEKVDDFISKPAAYMDELTWVHIWTAVKREVASKNKDLNGEELLQKCGERFTEVITKTQVYDSVLSRSANMRSKSVFMNMLTSFMGEPTTSINMLEDAITKFKRGDKKACSRQITSVGASILLNSALVSLVYAMRDDDEDETYAEKYLGSLVTELIEGINPITYYPIIKDVWSLLQGYDVERSDMSLISTAIDTLKEVVLVMAKNTSDMTEEELKEHNEEIVNAWISVAGDFSSLFGVPLKNIIREVKGFINLGKTVTNGYKTSGSTIGAEVLESAKNAIPIWNWFSDKSKADRLYDAIVSGDRNMADRIKDQYKSQKSIDTAMKKALRENDPRIRKAAEARNSGNSTEYSRIAKEIVGEGKFSQDVVVGAINGEINDINKGLEDTKTKNNSNEEKAESYYTSSDINIALENGDTQVAKTVIDDIVKTKVKNGKTTKEAKASVRSSVTSHWKPLYLSSNSSERVRIRKLLYATGLYGTLTELDKDLKAWRED